MIKLHPEGLAIPPVVDAALDAERPYYVIPWYERGSLQTAVDDGRYRLDPSQGIRLLLELSEAIEALHQHGYAHRDIKPGNVLVSDERLLLADFGLCIHVNDDPRLTGTGEAIGSRLYIPPENESGINEQIDQRPADFYGYGKLLWALLSGRAPPAREEILSAPWRLSETASVEKLSILEPLLQLLVNPDSGSRLRDWGIVSDELRVAHQSVIDRPTQYRIVSVRSPQENAGRLANLPRVREHVERSAELDRPRVWLDNLYAVIRESADEISPQLRELSEASAGMVKLVVSLDGPLLHEVFARDPSLRPEGLATDSGGQFRSIESGPVVGFQLTGMVSNFFPTMQLVIHRQRQDEKLWFFRIPSMTGPSGLIIPDWLLPQTYRAVGPMPFLLNQTVTAANQLVSEGRVLFLAMCEAYLRIAAQNGDVLDPSSWGKPPLDTDIGDS